MVAWSLGGPKNEAVYQKEHCAGSQVGSGYCLVLPLTHYVTLGKSLSV